jgi:hypothetical protein
MEHFTAKTLYEVKSMGKKKTELQLLFFFFLKTKSLATLCILAV